MLIQHLLPDLNTFHPVRIHLEGKLVLRFSLPLSTAVGTRAAQELLRWRFCSGFSPRRGVAHTQQWAPRPPCARSTLSPSCTVSCTHAFHREFWLVGCGRYFLVTVFAGPRVLLGQCSQLSSPMEKSRQVPFCFSDANKYWSKVFIF